VNEILQNLDAINMNIWVSIKVTSSYDISK
jgi:hypothetical protein